MLPRVMISTSILRLPSRVVSFLPLMKTNCRVRVVGVASSSNDLVDSGNEWSND